MKYLLNIFILYHVGISFPNKNACVYTLSKIDSSIDAVLENVITKSNKNPVVFLKVYKVNSNYIFEFTVVNKSDANVIFNHIYKAKNIGEFNYKDHLVLVFGDSSFYKFFKRDNKLKCIDFLKINKSNLYIPKDYPPETIEPIVFTYTYIRNEFVFDKIRRGAW